MCDFGGKWRCATTYLKIAQAKMGASGVGLVFACAMLGDSADGLWCSTTFLEIAHAKRVLVVLD